MIIFTVYTKTHVICKAKNIYIKNKNIFKNKKKIYIYIYIFKIVPLRYKHKSEIPPWYTKINLQRKYL